MNLNVLCQSPVSAGSSGSEALHNTVQLAELCDQLGYHRFWVAEHHSDPALAGAAPEILIAHLANRTRRIRVGSGGVQLPFYAPLKIAEQFRTLASLHPGRIDLGLGRSGGSEGDAPAALGMHRGDSWARVRETLDWCRGAQVRPETFASPSGADVLHPEPWILGTSTASAQFAGESGLPYAFGGFLDPRQMMPCLETYHRTFRPSRWADRPRVNLAWYVQAAQTEADAHAMTASSEAWFIRTFLRGDCRPFPDPATLANERHGPMEEMMVQMRRQFALVGTGEQVVDGLRSLLRQTAADEVTLVTIPYDATDRLNSYVEIARAAGLKEERAVSAEAS